MTRRARWFSRAVLVAATALFAAIGARYVVDPVGAVAPHRIVLGSAEAITVIRVSGGLFLGVAGVLGYCAVSAARLRAGSGVLAAVATAVTVTRLLGLVLDGPAPFTLRVLKPEVVLVGLATASLVLARSGALRVAGGRP
jgi:hypothetical protein